MVGSFPGALCPAPAAPEGSDPVRQGGYALMVGLEQKGHARIERLGCQPYAAEGDRSTGSQVVTGREQAYSDQSGQN